MKVESTLSTSLPFASDLSWTLFHSGSSWKDFQLAVAASRLGMLKNVDEGVALLRLIEGSPVSDAFHSVAVKDFYGVFAEACLQVAQFSWSCMVDAEFVDACRGLRRIGVVVLRSGPK